MLSELTGKKISYVDIPVKMLKENIIKSGELKEVSEFMRNFSELINEEEVDFIDSSLGKFIGRKPKALKSSKKYLLKIIRGEPYENKSSRKRSIFT